MYSLDQVIYFLEQRQQTEDWNIRDAAIAYLKGYREVLPEYAQMKLDKVTNEPLTWDELKTMEGKPVWAEEDDGKYKGWVMVGKFYSLFENEDLDAHVNLYYFGRSMEYSKEMYGFYWQAYRKERNENA